MEPIAHRYLMHFPFRRKRCREYHSTVPFTKRLWWMLDFRKSRITMARNDFRHLEFIICFERSQPHLNY